MAESGLIINSARVDDESAFSVETINDEIKLTSLAAGTTVLTVSREGDTDVLFNIEAVESNVIVANECFGTRYSCAILTTVL